VLSTQGSPVIGHPYLGFINLSFSPFPSPTTVYWNRLSAAEFLPILPFFVVELIFCTRVERSRSAVYLSTNVFLFLVASPDLFI